MSEKFSDNRAAAYAWMIPHISTVARTMGYAIGVHGSLGRDLDLIAVPWTDGASSNEDLVEAIRDAVGGYIRNDKKNRTNQYYLECFNPSHKPHGRRAWSIYFSGRRFYIDLSVMPLQPEAPNKAQEE